MSFQIDCRSVPKLLQLLIYLSIGILFPVEAQKTNSTRFRYLDSVIQSYEKKNTDSKSSVLILEMESGIVRYVFRPEIAIERKFSPGSLFKTFSALVFLKYKNAFSYSPEQTIDCAGKFYPEETMEITKGDFSTFHLPKDQNGKNYLRCSLAEGHGKVNLEQALVRSCNVYFLKIAGKNPNLFFSKLKTDWDLTNSTEARLKPYLEPSGNFEDNTTQLRMVSSAIGEGSFLVSPLKISQLYSSIWSFGHRLSPSWETAKRMKVSENPFSNRDLHFVSSMLSEVPETGTLKGLKEWNDSNIEILGAKTGTGTQYAKKYKTHGWVTLLFKRKNQDYILTVFVEKGSGGKEAKDLVLNILKEIGRRDSQLSWRKE
ncbi:penicillin-binding transpeptidase domain-containing protein [Leptospira sp. WS92.C1]